MTGAAVRAVGFSPRASPEGLVKHSSFSSLLARRLKPAAPMGLTKTLILVLLTRFGSATRVEPPADSYEYVDETEGHPLSGRGTQPGGAFAARHEWLVTRTYA